MWPLHRDDVAKYPGTTLLLVGDMSLKKKWNLAKRRVNSEWRFPATGQRSARVAVYHKKPTTAVLFSRFVVYNTFQIGLDLDRDLDTNTQTFRITYFVNMSAIVNILLESAYFTIYSYRLWNFNFVKVVFVILIYTTRKKKTPKLFGFRSSLTF